MDEHSLSRGLVSGQSLTAGQARAVAQLGRALGELREWFVDGVLTKALLAAKLTRGAGLSGDASGVWSQVKALARTSLAGNFSDAAIGVLCGVLVQWVQRCTPEGWAGATDTSQRAAVLEEVVSKLLSSFPVLQVGRAALKSSTVVKGAVLVPGSLARSHLLPPKFVLKDANVAVLACQVDRDAPTVSVEAVEVADAEQYVRAISFASAHVASMLDKLERRGVRLVVCTHPVPSYFDRLCEERGIVALPMVEDEDAALLCTVAGTLPVTNFGERALQECSLVRARRIDRVSLGGQPHVRFAGISALSVETEHTDAAAAGGGGMGSGQTWEARVARGTAQLLLCAPSAGLCKQYARALRRVLQQLKYWFQSRRRHESGEPLVTGGAGSAELATALVCNDFALRIKRDPAVRPASCTSSQRMVQAALTVLETAMLAVPMALAGVFSERFGGSRDAGEEIDVLTDDGSARGPQRRSGGKDPTIAYVARSRKLLAALPELRSKWAACQAGPEAVALGQLERSILGVPRAVGAGIRVRDLVLHNALDAGVLEPATACIDLVSALLATLQQLCRLSHVLPATRLPQAMRGRGLPGVLREEQVGESGGDRHGGDSDSDTDSDR